MKWASDRKKLIVLVHIAIILAVLGVSEPFDNVDYSLWVMLVGLWFLLLYYLAYRGRKLEYIPLFDLGITFCAGLIWVVLLYTSEYWSNISGWDALVYIFYPLLAAIFFGCQLAMNFVVFFIKWIRARKTRR